MNPEESLAQVASEDLPWLAFLYVSEELTPDEVVDFEERLVSDQSAREAVAQAMKTADGLWLASALDSLKPSASALPSSPRDEADPVAQHQAGKRLALWSASTVVAASLAFSVGWWFAQQQRSQTPPASLAHQNAPQRLAQVSSDFPQAIEGAEELLGLWSDSHALLAELGSGPAVGFPSEMSEDYHADESQDTEEEAFAWMLAAVSTESGDASPIKPEVMEN